MIVGILLVAFLIRLVGITQSFWLDEAAQMIESVRPLTQQLDIAGDFRDENGQIDGDSGSVVTKGMKLEGQIGRASCRERV